MDDCPAVGGGDDEVDDCPAVLADERVGDCLAVLVDDGVGVDDCVAILEVLAA